MSRQSSRDRAFDPQTQSFSLDGGVFHEVPNRSPVIRRGHNVHVLGLPGCWSQGAKEEDAIENIYAAIREYLGAVEIIHSV
jgi:hypothetical protein